MSLLFSLTCHVNGRQGIVGAQFFGLSKFMPTLRCGSHLYHARKTPEARTVADKMLLVLPLGPDNTLGCISIEGDGIWLAIVFFGILASLICEAFRRNLVMKLTRVS